MEEDLKIKVKKRIQRVIEEIYNERTDSFNLDLISIKVQSLKAVERKKNNQLNFLLKNEVNKIKFINFIKS